LGRDSNENPNGLDVCRDFMLRIVKLKKLKTLQNAVSKVL